MAREHQLQEHPHPAHSLGAKAAGKGATSGGSSSPTCRTRCGAKLSPTFEASKGTDRVVTHLRLDERRGEPLTLEGKVQGALGLRPDQK